MRRALSTAALAFTVLASPFAFAQSPGASTQSQQGGRYPQVPGTFEPGDYAPTPEGSTGAEDNSGSQATGTGSSYGAQGTGGSGAQGTGATRASGSSDDAGTGGAGPGAASTGNTGMTDTRVTVGADAGMGGSGVDHGSDAGTGGSGDAGGRAPATPQGTEPQDSMGDAHGGSAEAASSGKKQTPEELTREVAMLRSDVLRLQRQVNGLSSKQKGATNDTRGTGGSGPGASSEDNTPKVDPAKTVVANVVMRGQVTSTSPQRIVVRDAETGDLYNLRLGQNTQVLHGGKRIEVQNLREGTSVQASYNLFGDGHSAATRIQVEPRPR
ncbi:hypothetical protein [Myxococcus stipitatus]|uniref:hypothetical protein n=1 Tax=Myxococcus stipitatus TaxID=83455 RepID=UPI0030CC0AB7